LRRRDSRDLIAIRLHIPIATIVRRAISRENKEAIAMRQFFAIVFEESDGDFVVTFPDLPECVTFVESLEAAPAAAAEALDDRLLKLEWIGKAIPEPSTYEAIRRDLQNVDCEVIRVEAMGGVAH
jgi:predicted RNase H-like HicB family nuclease